MKPYYDHAGITIYHGDCREVIPYLPPVDVIVTDPPYGMGRFRTDGKEYLQTVGPALNLAWHLVKDGGSMFVFASTGEVIKVANAVKAPFKRLLWVYKPNDCTFPLAGWLLKSEAILWFADADHPLTLHDRHPYRHDTYVHTRVGQEGVEGHPTVKPLWVTLDLVSRCPVYGVVLDPFLGSGTTLRAAKDIGRRAIGIELEERYCEMAARRLAQEVLPLEENRVSHPESEVGPGTRGQKEDEMNGGWALSVLGAHYDNEELWSMWCFSVSISDGRSWDMFSVGRDGCGYLRVCFLFFRMRWEWL